MIQITATLLIVAIGCISVAISWAMIAQNQSAILSALAGRGAFPQTLSPDTGPAVIMPLPPRSKYRAARRPVRTRAAQNWSRAA